MTQTQSTPNLEQIQARLRKLGMHGLAAQAAAIIDEPWLARVLEVEESERTQRSLKRRMTQAKLGSFTAVADFDWSWPTRCDRALYEELYTLAFIEEAVNVFLVGPNGLGKTMLMKNLVHRAVQQGYSARYTLASDMLRDLAAQDSSRALGRRLRDYTTPTVLAVDEVAYLSYDARYADLLFEVVSRRYLQRPILLTTNKGFTEWGSVFPNATTVVTLVDRLVHRSEEMVMEGKSYRLKEARERAERGARRRRQPKP